MHGTLDIRKETTPGRGGELYQVRYEDLAGNSFVGSMNNEALRELLYHKLALPLSDDELDRPSHSRRPYSPGRDPAAGQ